MHAFAFGAKCGAFGARGLARSFQSAASRPSSRSIEARATRPAPLAALVRKRRRLRCRLARQGCMVEIPRSGLVSGWCGQLLPNPGAEGTNHAQVIERLGWLYEGDETRNGDAR